MTTISLKDPSFSLSLSWASSIGWVQQWFGFSFLFFGTKPFGFGGDHGGCGCGCGDGSVGFNLGLAMAMAMVMDVVVALDLVKVGCANKGNGS